MIPRAAHATPASRSARASYIKKLIKERTCRRTIKHENSVENGKKTGKKTWHTSYLKGYIEQAFARLNVSERLSYGPENEPHLQRADYLRTTGGRDKERWRKWREETDEQTSPLRPRNMTESLELLLERERDLTGTTG